MIDFQKLEELVSNGRALDVWHDCQGFRAALVIRNAPIHEDHIFTAPTIQEAIAKAMEYPGE